MTLEQRQQLVQVMLADVIASAKGAGLQPIVLSPDDAVLAQAELAGVIPLRQASRVNGLNAALFWAIKQLFGAPSVLILLPDTPLTSPSEITELLSGAAADQLTEADKTGRSSSRARVVAVPDRARQGTNALLLDPAQTIPLAFGPRSLARHREAADRAGVDFSVQNLPGIALDLDTADDVAAFLSEPRDTQTRRFLLDLHIGTSEGRSGLLRSLPARARTPRILRANSPIESQP